MNITAEAFRYHKSREINCAMWQFRKLKREEPSSIIDRYAHIMKLAALAGHVVAVIRATRTENNATMLPVNFDKDGE